MKCSVIATYLLVTTTHAFRRWTAAPQSDFVAEEDGDVLEDAISVTPFLYLIAFHLCPIFVAVLIWELNVLVFRRFRQRGVISQGVVPARQTARTMENDIASAGAIPVRQTPKTMENDIASAGAVPTRQIAKTMKNDIASTGTVPTRQTAKTAENDIASADVASIDVNDATFASTTSADVELEAASRHLQDRAPPKNITMCYALVQTEHDVVAEFEMCQKLASAREEGETAERLRLKDERIEMEQQMEELRSRLGHAALTRQGLETQVQMQRRRLLRAISCSGSEKVDVHAFDFSSQEALVDKESEETQMKQLQRELSAVRAELHACQTELDKERIHSNQLASSLQAAQMRLIMFENGLQSDGPQHFNIASEGDGAESCISGETIMEGVAKEKACAAARTFEATCGIVRQQWHRRKRPATVRRLRSSTPIIVSECSSTTDTPRSAVGIMEDEEEEEYNMSLPFCSDISADASTSLPSLSSEFSARPTLEQAIGVEDSFIHVTACHVADGLTEPLHRNDDSHSFESTAEPNEASRELHTLSPTSTCRGAPCDVHDDSIDTLSALEFVRELRGSAHVEGIEEAKALEPLADQLAELLVTEPEGHVSHVNSNTQAEGADECLATQVLDLAKCRHGTVLEKFDSLAHSSASSTLSNPSSPRSDLIRRRSVPDSPESASRSSGTEDGSVFDTANGGFCSGWAFGG
eukprot:TRINITY_DN14403_c0_g1_i4.p1 TRINITY_DN14403_c0_g1~~TRINITY_DN14403_c0_g1_i4.p1  ORF type:complete len:700 (+),score=105.94 TRINITY_DN14403_c0_g1_i4:104-2203(+)